MTDTRIGIFVLALAISACAAPGGGSRMSELGITPSIAPGDDFYGYANDAWIKATALPEGASRIDTTSQLRAENARRVQALIEGASGGASEEERKIADYYAARLDSAAIEAKGFAPLGDELGQIAEIKDRKALAAALGRATRLDDGSNTATESLWGIWIHPGFHDPDHYAVHMVQGGLGLSDIDDYLGADHTAHRDLYRAHIAAVLKLAGLDRTAARAARVLALEIAIARTHALRADTETDNDWTRADFDANAPGIDWSAFFQAAGLGDATRFVVWQPKALGGSAHLVATAPLEAWKDYLAFHLVEHDAAVLPKSVGDEAAAFASNLTGTPAGSPDRTKEARAATEAVFADAIGRLYVARYFPPEAKAAAVAMVDTIKAAFRNHLERATWMGVETKAKALAKLDSLRIGLGYPEHWIDYGALTVAPGDAFGNLKRAEDFAYRREIAKLSRPVDPDEWAGQLHPQMVGAILNLSPNTMQFTAGILQPPYFDPSGDAAANYGSAGAGLAHEISHSFDPVGNLYDAQGRLGFWWTEEDTARYRAAIAPLAAQLDACCPLPDACGHGEQILDESAADLVGLAVAYDAYHASLRGKEDRAIHGLTGDQRFFIAFAQRWRRLQTDAALRQQIEGDNHAPPACRASLARNMEAWHRAFDVQPGRALYLAPEARIQPW